MLHFLTVNVGPFYPTRAYSGGGGGGLKAAVRPARPQFQMYLHAGQLEISKVGCMSKINSGICILIGYYFYF